MSHEKKSINRRDFLRLSKRLASGLIVMPILQACQALGLIEAAEAPVPSSTSTNASTSTSTPPEIISSTPTPLGSLPTETPLAVPEGHAAIAFVRTRDRKEGVRRAISLLGQNTVQGKSVILKPNFNSADPAPASTHPETLRALAESLQEMGAGQITIADRAGMGDTKAVMNALGVYDLAAELGLETLAFEDLTNEEDWTLIQEQGHHWRGGFPVPKVLLEAEAIVQTCCLKPHRFGGHFTLSLKNTVGMVGKFRGRGGRNFMTELHTSLSQRLMIAEANTVYQPALVVLDGVEAFIDKGPEEGTKAWGEVMLAGTDRVALDAVGLALLRYLGYTGVAAGGPIFAQEQIARAVELGLGIDGPDKITFITDDPESAAYAAQIQGLMLSTG